MFKIALNMVFNKWALYLDKSDYRSRMPFILLRISEL